MTMSTYLKAVILAGGPSRGTRFRPLSLTTPKPLFPVAGEPIIYHHLKHISHLQNVKEVLIIGFYDSALFADFLARASIDFPQFSIKYLREYTSLGTAGGLYHFRDAITKGGSDAFFVLNADVCCTFPLQPMADEISKISKANPEAVGVILGTRAPKDHLNKYGCLVKDDSTGQVLHYVEKPETFISDLISCGIYIFSNSVFQHIGRFLQEKEKVIGEESAQENLRLEQDVLAPLAGQNMLYVVESNAFWRPVKTPGSALAANQLYLEDFLLRGESPISQQSFKKLKKGKSFTDLSAKPELVEPVYIHPSAAIDVTARIGPNVSIGPGVTIGPGVRISNSIILNNVSIQENSIVKYAIIGWDSKLGQWCRVEGTAEPYPNSAMTENGKKLPNIAVLGAGITLSPEIIIRNCVVLPNKELKSSYHNEILM